MKQRRKQSRYLNFQLCSPEELNIRYSEVKHIHFVLPVLPTWIISMSEQQPDNETKTFLSLILYLNGQSTNAVFIEWYVLFQLLNFHTDFMMATEVLLFMRWTLGFLTVAIPKIVKAAEEADAAHEFITNLANDVKPKLQQSTSILNFNKRVNRKSRRLVQEAVGNYNQRRNTVSYCTCVHVVIGII
uniref:Uncharacterized protein n=1 Tax=Vespula pensylvanica TaxID=30213 RepID=A0A834JNL3_VESPE|nr:hypothetical protein H0235_017594 [Vespula pensylvanica]